MVVALPRFLFIKFPSFFLYSGNVFFESLANDSFWESILLEHPDIN